MVAKKNCTGSSSVSCQDQHSYSTASVVMTLNSPVVAEVSITRGSPPPLFLFLLGLVCFVRGEEGHAVGPEVGVEVRGLVETPPAHLAAQIPFSVLAQCLRGGGRRAVGRAVSTGGAAVCIALGVPHAVRDEAVPAEGAGRREADAALQALEGGGVGSVLGDVALKLRPILGGEAAGDTTENVVFLLQVAGRRCRRGGRSGSLCRTRTLFTVLCGVLFLVSYPDRRRSTFAILF